MSGLVLADDRCEVEWTGVCPHGFGPARQRIYQCRWCARLKRTRNVGVRCFGSESDRHPATAMDEVDRWEFVGRPTSPDIVTD